MSPHRRSLPDHGKTTERKTKLKEEEKLIPKDGWVGRWVDRWMDGKKEGRKEEREEGKRKSKEWNRIK